MDNDKQRAALLSALWDAQAQAMLDTLRNCKPGEVRGSTLKEIRQFLLDNGITIETVVREKAHERLLEEMHQAVEGMPTIEELDEYK